MNGPMESAMEIFTDFFNYKSGIYKHASGSYAGGHAIKVIGWGREGDTEYWICANSWGETWGENGFFKIAMSEIDADTAAYGCTPDSSALVGEEFSFL
jgi:cathepsin B